MGKDVKDERNPVSDIKVTHNVSRSRYEVTVDGEVVGTAAYAKRDGAIAFVSTRVQPEFQNRGLAARLAQMSLDDARSEGLRVLPQCSYYAIYIERHPEYADLVD